MKPNNTLFLTLSCIILLGLSGCAKYHARPMKQLVTVGQSAERTISVSYKVFNAYDCEKYLGRNTIEKGYQPVQVTITNNSDRYFNISPNSFNCDCISPDEVAEKMHTNTAGRAVGYGVMAWVLFPILAIPAIVDGIGSSKANRKLDADYDRKALYDQTIQPYTTVNGIIFISTEEHTRHITATSSTPQTINAMY